MDYYKLYVTVRVQLDKKRCFWSEVFGQQLISPEGHFTLILENIQSGGKTEIAIFILRQLENPDVKPVGRVGHYEERPQREEGLLSGRLDRWTGEWK